MAATSPNPRAGVRLSVDLGTATTAAIAACPDGRRLPVLFGGTTTMPSGVYIAADGQLLAGGAARHAAKDHPDRYVAEPKRHISAETLTVAGQDVDVIDLLAAPLRSVAAAATHLTGVPITSTVLAVPPGWGPRRRDVLRQAARHAGLPDPALITEPIAVASHHWHDTAYAGSGAAPGAVAAGAIPTLPVDGCVLVADVGAGGCALTVLQRTPDGFDLLATQMVPDAGGGDVDTMIAAYAIAHADTDNPADMKTGPSDPAPALLAEARRAKESLWHNDSALIPVPGRSLPVVVDATVLAELADPLRQRITAAVTQVIAAADVHPEQIHVVLAAGYAARLPGLTDALAKAAAAPCVLITYPDTAVAEGALHATTTAAPATATPALPAWATSGLPDQPPSLRPRGHAVLAGLIGAASLAVLAQTLTTVDVYPRGLDSYIPSGYGGFATAALLAILAATGLAHTVAATAPTAPTPALGTRAIRQSYTAAAVIGMIVAGLYGLFAITMLDLTNTPIMKWVLLAPLPVAIGALLVGLLAAGIPPPLLPAWLHRIRPQVLPPLLAAAGTLLVQTVLTVGRPWYVPSAFYLLGGWAGAAALGAAIALTATRHRGLRMITVPLLSVGAAAVLTLGTATLFAVAYAAAAGWAWATTTGITLAAAYPNARAGIARSLRRITQAGSTGPSAAGTSPNGSLANTPAGATGQPPERDAPD